MEANSLMEERLKQGFKTFIEETSHYGFDLRVVRGYYCESTSLCDCCGKGFTEDVLVTPVIVHDEIRWQANLPLYCPECRRGERTWQKQH